MALILIVENEKVLRWGLGKRLTQARHEVHAAETLPQARDYLRSSRPEVALLQLSLPDGHGLDFLERGAWLTPRLPMAALVQPDANPRHGRLARAHRAARRDGAGDGRRTMTATSENQTQAAELLAISFTTVSRNGTGWSRESENAGRRMLGAQASRLHAGNVGVSPTRLRFQQGDLERFLRGVGGRRS